MIFWASLLAFILISCFDSTAQQQEYSDLRITIQRDYCFGSCPVYSAIILGDGTVIYKGKDFVQVKGERRYKISKEKVKQLVDEAIRMNYFSLKDSYTEDEQGMSYTDLPSTTTSIRMNGRSKQVYNYYGAPKELSQFQNKIDETAGLTRFIGKR
jgi:Domain of unknown function (DUF6438)